MPYKALSAILFFVFVLSIFTSCSQKSTTSRGELYERALDYTKQSTIKMNDGGRVVVTATYLNHVTLECDTKCDNFVIGLYNTRGFSSLSLQDSITLNGSKPIEVSELGKSSLLYGNLPLFNSWAKHYEVKFNKEANSALDLLYFKDGLVVKIKF
jgi:hypothetical protein